MSITTTEIARICHVSRGTVDRALNDRPGINPKTKALILRTAKELGYTPHLLASSLATGKTHTVGLVVFDLNSRHFAALVDSAHRSFAGRGILCYICISEKQKDQEIRLIKDLIARKVDGIIISPINNGADFCDRLHQWGKPVVAVNNALDERFAYVGGNSDEAVYFGMQHFWQKGYRKVLFICPPYRRLGQENLHAQRIRAEGFLRYMDDTPQMHGRLVADEAYLETVLSAVHSNQGGKLGIFCSSDHYALKIYKAARERGFRAPEDFGLMGFDGVDTLQYLDQMITTIRYPAEAIGDTSAACLYAMIHGTQASQRQHILACRLMEGATV